MMTEIHWSGHLATESSLIAFNEPSTLVPVIRDLVTRSASETALLQSQLVTLNVSSGVQVHADIHGADVSDDGNFEGAARVFMLKLLIWVTPRQANQASYSNLTVNNGDIHKLRMELFPWIDDWYQIEPFTAAQWTYDWMFASFLDSDGATLDAAADFDWVKHRVRHRNMQVTQINVDGTKRKPIYINSGFADFYQSHKEGRGRFLELASKPPPVGSGAEEAFRGLVQGLRRRGVLGRGIAPLSIEWKNGNTAAFRYRDDLDPNGADKNALIVDIPDRDDLFTGNFKVPFDHASIKSVDQYVAAILSYLRETLNIGRPIV